MVAFCEWCGIPDRPGSWCLCAGRVRDPASLEALIDAAQRGEKLRVLAAADDPAGLDDYHAIVGRDEPRAQGAALSVIANVASVESWDVVETVMESLSVDPNPPPESLERPMEGDSAEVVQQKLWEIQDASQRQRQWEKWAAETGQHGLRYYRKLDARGRDRLAALQEHPRWGTEATYWLADTGDERAAKGLSRLLAELTSSTEMSQPNASVAYSVTRSLQSLGGAPGLRRPCLDLMAAGAGRFEQSGDDPRSQHRLVGSGLWELMSLIGYQFRDSGDPEAVRALADAEARSGLKLISDGPAAGAAHRARPKLPTRFVEAWALDTAPVDHDGGPGTRFGGQPAWRSEPTWPLSSQGTPMAFWAQFEIPNTNQMAYLFVEAGDFPTLDDDTSTSMFVQPDGAPPHVPTQPRTRGPVLPHCSRSPEIDPTAGPLLNTSEIYYSFAPKVPSLTPFQDPDHPDDSSIERSNPHTINKIGGSPFYPNKAPGEPTIDPKWQLLFEFDANTHGLDLPDLGLVYFGYISDDGTTRIDTETW